MANLDIRSAKHDRAFFAKNMKLYQAVMLVVLGVLFIAFTAQLTIPLVLVPITLQPLAVLLLGLFLGPNLGSRAVMVYLFAGLCGLPVFAGLSSGLSIMLGPTGGYLIGFMGMVYLTGYLLQHGWHKSWLHVFGAALLGEIVLFISGYLVLTYFVGYRNAYRFGVAPFYWIELARLWVFVLIAVPFLRKK